MEENTLINRVDQSGILTIDLEQMYPTTPVASFDLKDHLFQGLILKEKDFREALKSHDWQKYAGSVLCVYCSTDAIIPVWAYMLVSSFAASVAHTVYNGTPAEWLRAYYHQAVQNMDATLYAGKRIVIKGCSHKEVPTSAYTDVTALLQPLAQSIMYGEPCSTVPIFKRPRVLENSSDS